MDVNEKLELISWALDHHCMILGVYHDTPRMFTPISMWNTKAGLLRMSAYDSTHGDEETPRTYKVDEMLLLGVARFRAVKVTVRERDAVPADNGRREGQTGRSPR